MTVTLTSAVPVSAGPNDIVTTIIAPNVPGGGGLGIGDITGLVAALDSKLDDSLGDLSPGLIGAVTVTGVELNTLAGITGSVQVQLDGKVDLTGDIMSGSLIFGAGAQIELDPSATAALPALVFVGDLDTGLWWPGADTLGFAVGTVDALHILPTGLLEAQVGGYEALVTGGGINSIPNKKYVLDEIALAVGGPFLPLAGGSMTGDIELDGVARLRLDADDDTFLEALADDLVNMWVGGSVEFFWNATCFDMGGKKISDVLDPVNPQEAATMNYVDTEIVALALNGVGPYLRLSGADIMVGDLDLGGNNLRLDGDGDTFWESSADDLAQLWVGGALVLGMDGSTIDAKIQRITDVVDPLGAQDAATMNYVDTEILALSLGGTVGPYLPLSGVDAMVGALDMGTNLINNVVNPVGAQDASTKDYVDTEILALGLGGATGPFLRLSGVDTMVGNLDLGANRVISVADPVAAQDAVTLAFADATYTPIGGGVPATGDLDMGGFKIVDLGFPTAGGDATSKTYTDGTFLALAGDTMTGALNMGTNVLEGLSTPVAGDEAAPKDYVDTEIGLLGLTGVGPYLELAGGLMTGDLSLDTSIQVLADDGTLGAPGYAFLSDDTTGLFTDGTNLRLALAGADGVTIAPTEVDVHSRKISGVADPVADDEAVNKGFLDAQAHTKLLGSVSGVDLTSTGATLVYTVPAAKMHIITNIIVRSTSFSGSPSDPGVSVFVTYDTAANKIVPSDTTISWGGTGAGEQAVYLDPKDGSPTPNALATVNFDVDTAATGTLVATVYVLGIEL